MSNAFEVAKALETCDWSGVPIGSKAIIAQAIELLSAQQAEPVARDVLMAALDDLDNEVVNNHGIGMPFELRQKIADRHAAKLPAVPDGYALVPIDPTEEMLAVGQQEWLDSDGADPSFDIYRAMLASAPQAAVATPMPPYDTFSNDDGDGWQDCPDDVKFVNGRQLGEEFELLAGWHAERVTFRVTKVPDDENDDYKVEEVATPAAAQKSGAQ